MWEKSFEMIRSTSDGKLEPYGFVTYKEADWYEKALNSLTFGYFGSKYKVKEKEVEGEKEPVLGIALESVDNEKQETVEVDLSTTEVEIK